MDDNTLLQLLITDREQGLSLLMNQYMNYVTTIVYGKLNQYSKEDIEECVSDVFLKFYKNTPLIDLTRASIKTYLVMIARNTAIDYYRTHKLHLTDSPLDEVPETDLEASPEALESVLIRKESNQALRDAINRLGEPDRELMIRKYFFFQKSSQIALALNLKPNTVDQKARRALTKLRMMLGGIDEHEEAL